MCRGKRPMRRYALSCQTMLLITSETTVVSLVSQKPHTRRKEREPFGRIDGAVGSAAGRRAKTHILKKGTCNVSNVIHWGGRRVSPAAVQGTCNVSNDTSLGARRVSPAAAHDTSNVSNDILLGCSSSFASCRLIIGFSSCPLRTVWV